MTETYAIPDFLRKPKPFVRAPVERPILFSAPMIRALLAGTKTQTRRIIKPQPGVSYCTKCKRDAGLCECFFAGDHDANQCTKLATSDISRCPYGQPGDRLWVRENGWERPDRTPKMMREGADTWAPYYFDADYEFGATRDNEFAEFKEWGFKRRPSIHMPRWASRILLEITAVRVERLTDISEADAEAEGTPCYVCGGALDGRSESDCHCFHRKATPSDYSALWESINGHGSWERNDWVWVIQFRRVTP